MNILLVLIPTSLLLGFGALIVFIWGLTRGQLDDPKGNAERILLEDD